jgi:hypothetical protein
MRSIITVLAAAALVALGVVIVMYGAVDDSPGASLIGMVLIAGTLGFGARRVWRRG